MWEVMQVESTFFSNLEFKKTHPLLMVFAAAAAAAVLAVS
jgi:hypothetical protein